MKKFAFFSLVLVIAAHALIAAEQGPVETGVWNTFEDLIFAPAAPQQADEAFFETKATLAIDGVERSLWLYDTYTYFNGMAEPLHSKYFPFYINLRGYNITKIRHNNPNADGFVPDEVKELLKAQKKDVAFLFDSMSTEKAYVFNYDAKSKKFWILSYSVKKNAEMILPEPYVAQAAQSANPNTYFTTEEDLFAAAKKVHEYCIAHDTDVNNDGDINCQDRAITFYNQWCKNYSWHQCFLAANNGPHLEEPESFSHLFIALTTNNPDGSIKQAYYIEPFWETTVVRDHTDSMDMHDIWDFFYWERFNLVDSIDMLACYGFTQTPWRQYKNLSYDTDLKNLIAEQFNEATAVAEDFYSNEETLLGHMRNYIRTEYRTSTHAEIPCALFKLNKKGLEHFAKQIGTENCFDEFWWNNTELLFEFNTKGANCMLTYDEEPEIYFFVDGKIYNLYEVSDSDMSALQKQTLPLKPYAKGERTVRYYECIDMVDSLKNLLNLSWQRPFSAGLTVFCKAEYYDGVLKRVYSYSKDQVNVIEMNGALQPVSVKLFTTSGLPCTVQSGEFKEVRFTYTKSGLVSGIKYFFADE